MRATKSDAEKMIRALRDVIDVVDGLSAEWEECAFIDGEHGDPVWESHEYRACRCLYDAGHALAFAIDAIYDAQAKEAG